MKKKYICKIKDIKFHYKRVDIIFIWKSTFYFSNTILKKIFYILLFSLFAISSKAQSPDFSQITTNLLFTNPAFAGTKICPRLITGYRNKFVSLGSVYQTFYATYDQYFDDLKGDLGITFINDLQSKGVVRNTMAGLIYAKDVNITSKLTLKLALQGEYLQHSVNTSQLSYPDMIDPIYGFIYNSGEQVISSQFHKANLSAGMLMYSEKQYFGISLFNINQPTSSLAKNNYLLQRKISLHYAYNIMLRPDQRTIKDAYFFLPNILIFNQGKSTQIMYGMNVTKNFLMGGISIKQNVGTNFDSFMLLIGFIQKRFKFAYDCDVSLMKVSGSLFDTHEVSFTFFFNCVEKKKKNKAINCPGI